MLTPRRLETPRWVLRPARADDLAAIVSAVRAPRFPKRLPLAELSDEALARWLEGMCRRAGAVAALLWSIDDVQGGIACMGQVSLVRKPDLDAWNLAFWLHPAHWGRGIAREAVGRAIDEAFAACDVPALHAGVANWNTASMRTVERLGFRHTGDNPSGYRVAGAPEPIRVYELTRAQWRAGRGSRDET
jgi:RimJ/RimL family protein N-acetyltransferase